MNTTKNTTKNTKKITPARYVVGAAAIAAVVGVTAACGTQSAAEAPPATQIGGSERIYTSDAVKDAAARHAYIKAWERHVMGDPSNRTAEPATKSTGASGRPVPGFMP